MQANRQDSAAERRDLHTEITNKIVAAIEAGAGEWRMPWRSHNQGMPTNASTGARYRGVNIITLWTAGTAAGYPRQEWASYKQWGAKGAHVRKGERGSMIVFYRTIDREVTDSATGEVTEEQIPLLRYSHVFNAAQVDGYEAKPVERPALAKRVSDAEAFVASTRATINYGLGRAFYAPGRDIIGMPIGPRSSTLRPRLRLRTPMAHSYTSLRIGRGMKAVALVTSPSGLAAMPMPAKS
jgi:antirestriction protein ArdC